MRLKSGCCSGRMLIVAAAFAFSPLMHALEISEWKNRQALTVEHAGVVTATLPPETLDAARPGLEDLRVVDSSGRELPFVLIRPRREPVVPVAARNFRATLTDSTTQLVVTGGRELALEAVVLETPATNFVKRARVETSPNGTDWRTHATDVPVFRQAGVEQLTIQCGADAFVRITFDDTRSRPVPFTGAKLVPLPTAAPAALPLPVRVAGRDEFVGETAITLDLGAANLPLASLAFSTPEPLFTRHVRVGVRELRDDTAIERTLASGSIFRVALEGSAAAARLEVPLELSAPLRELLVHIDNGDSPPLAIDSLTIAMWPVRLLLHAPAAGTYSLLTGHSRIAAPRYDLAALETELKRAAGATAPIGPLAPNPDYRPSDALADTPLLGAALDPSPWRFRKSVRFAAAGVQQLELDLDVLSRAQPGFADLRLVRDGVQVPYLLERPGVSRSLDLALTMADDPRLPRLSRWQIRLPRSGLPLVRLTLNAATPLFQRQLRLFERISDHRGNTHERTLASLAWSRTPGDTRPIVLHLGSPPSTDTLLLETDNGDNPALALTGATSAYPVTRLLFKSDAAPVALYYGNPQASTPRYDLTLVASQIITAEKGVATLEPEEKARGDGWAATALGGARGGILFWGVLALVVVVLLVIVAKLLPKQPATM